MAIAEAADQVEANQQPTQPPPMFLYAGESSRGCLTRFNQHVDKYTAKDNFMWTHVQEVHDGVMGSDPSKDFFIRRESRDSEPIRRILRESIRINRLRKQEEKGTGSKGKTVVLNGKEEWFGVKVVQPRFVQE